jgi:PleD family two-component response regulator
MFEFREAQDGEQAWETLLLDQNIRVVITDLTMPKLDGYGLLQRIRTSKVSRIRNVPVIVVSGSGDDEERERAKAAGANDLITKGIATAQLLSRLDVLSRLVATQYDLERNLVALVHRGGGDEVDGLPASKIMQAEAAALLAASIECGKNFVVLDVCIALSDAVVPAPYSPSAEIIDAVGRILQHSIRQTDHLAQTAPTHFTIATGNIDRHSAHAFAQRICNAIEAAGRSNESATPLLASCGVVCLIGDDFDGEASLAAMMKMAHQRALANLERHISEGATR